MTKKGNGNITGSPRMSAGAGLRGTARRGRRVRGQGAEKEAQLIPVLERLRPRHVKAVRLTGGLVTEPSPSQPRNRMEQGDREVVDLIPNKVVSPQHREDLKTSINSTDSGSVEGVTCTTRSDTITDTAERGGEGVCLSRGEEGMPETGEDNSSEQLVPHVPKLRRTHAMCVSKDASGVKGEIVNSPNDPDDLSSTAKEEGLTQSKVATPCPVGDTGGAGVIQTKRIQRKRGRSRRAAHLIPSSLLPNTSTTTPSPSSDVSAVEDSQRSEGVCVDRCITDSARTSVVEDITDHTICDSTEGDSTENDSTEGDSTEGEEWEYPQPSTNYQKTQRQLARQRQLEDMRAREAAYAREERLLRRQGLSKSPEKSKRKHLTWKDESELVEVFCYSPCSSRGSTMEPDDTSEQ